MRDDAVVAVGPLDAEGVAADLLQGLDPVPRALRVAHTFPIVVGDFRYKAG
jgi:hypothetical protein